MRVLSNVQATAEQLTILKHDKKGTLIIRGAAGSGKTTTALLRLKVVSEFFAQQFRAMNQPLNVLVLTYNRTLAGYIEELTRKEAEAGAANAKITINVDTFASWARAALGIRSIVESNVALIRGLGEKIGLDDRFLCNEVDYALGRFMPLKLNEYLITPREGRGNSPQMPTKRRERLMSEVIKPYIEWKRQNSQVDWNDLAVMLATTKLPYAYHVVVVDETQDFHANQIRAVMNQLAPQHSLTFVLDSAQRIYPNFFRWHEVGIASSNANTRTLSRNYRNTQQIAAFAAPLIDGIDIGPDGALPNFSNCKSIGPLPVILLGKFSAQAKRSVDYIRSKVDLTKESVAFLHPKGKGWFDEVRRQLAAAGLPYEELTREREWPASSTNIALSTMHSAKGLEFDHVIAIGLSGKATSHGTDPGDVEFEELRRLLAMAIGRAKKSVIIGYKPSEATALVSHFKSGTFVSERV